MHKVMSRTDLQLQEKGQKKWECRDWLGSETFPYENGRYWLYFADLCP